MPYADHNLLSLFILVMILAFYGSGLALGVVMLYRHLRGNPSLLAAAKTGASNLVAYFGRHIILAIIAIVLAIYFLPGLVYPVLVMGSFLFASAAWLLFLFGLSKPYLRDAGLALRGKPAQQTRPTFNPTWTASIKQAGSTVAPAPAVAVSAVAGSAAGSSNAGSPVASQPNAPVPSPTPAKPRINTKI
jgi:hypothetical protein